MSGSKGGVAAGLVATGGAGAVCATAAGCTAGQAAATAGLPFRATLNVAHGLKQSLVTLLRRSVAINLQQFSEVAYEGGIGKQLGPIRTRRRNT